MIVAFDHVQVMIPTGKLDDALAFYVDVLGFTRVPKPVELRQSGAWLVSGDVHLHLGEDLAVDAADFVASPNAHPAFRVDNFLALADIFEQKMLKVRVDSGPHGFHRGSVWDPFGNRIELMQEKVVA